MNIRNTFKITTAALALIGSVDVANAADLAVAPVEPAAPIPYAFSWTGFYVGANIGYGFSGDDKVGVQGALYRNDFDKFDNSGVLGGLQAGYNYQMGSFVIGIETDIQAAAIDDDISGATAAIPNGFAYKGSTKTNWFGTLRPRVGFAWDRALIYATGGLAYGGVDYNLKGVDGNGNAFNIDNSDTRVGWTAGAGVEYAFTDNWTAKIEYKYVNLGSDRVSAPLVGGGIGNRTVSTKETPAFNSVTLGINYKF